jgi:uncharacterized LabA/DUF88 family protein
MIGEMNCLVQVQSVSVTQDTDGNIIATPSSVWNKWGKRRQNCSNLASTEGMSNYQESYTVEMWYERNRPTRANYLLTYDGKTMKVLSVRLDNEGTRVLETVTAYTSN